MYNISFAVPEKGLGLLGANIFQAARKDAGTWYQVPVLPATGNFVRSFRSALSLIRLHVYRPHIAAFLRAK